MTYRWIVFLDEESLNELHGERGFTDTSAAEDDDLVFTHSLGYLAREKYLKRKTQCDNVNGSYLRSAEQAMCPTPPLSRHASASSQLEIEATQRMIIVAFEDASFVTRIDRLSSSLNRLCDVISLLTCEL